MAVSALATAVLAFLAFEVAWIRSSADVRHLSLIDAELYKLTWVHPGISVVVFACFGLALLLVAAGIWWGWRWTRPVGTASLALATVGAYVWTRASGDDLTGGAAVFLFAFGTAVLVGSPQARAWFGRPDFEATPLGRAWTTFRSSALKVGERIPLSGAALVLIAVGVVARIATVWTMDLWADGATYSAMGQSWMQHHEFLMPWGDVTTGPLEPAAFSHHYPPLYPLYLGLVYSGLGYGYLQTKFAAVAVALAALAVVYLCTRDLYGPRIALLITAILAAEPHLVWSAGTGFSENMVLLWFTITMWGIVKSLDRPPFILAAGFGAGMAYLTRSSVGPFFLIAGLGGLLWRFHFQRWKALANGWYLAAAAIFLSMFGWWAWRNVTHFGGWPAWDAPWSAEGGVGAIASFIATSPRDLMVGGLAAGGIALVFWLGRPQSRDDALPQRVVAQRWAYAAAGVACGLAAILGWAWMARNGAAHGWPMWETSKYTSDSSAFAFQNTGLLVKALLYKVPFFLIFFGWYAIFLIPEVRASWRRIREEHESALWLAVILVFLIAWFISSEFWVTEQTSLFWFDNHRYIVIAFVPLLWALLRKRNVDEPSVKLRSFLLAISLAAMMLFLFIAPVRFATTQAAENLNGHLHGGETIAFDGATNKYLQYPYMRSDITMVQYLDMTPPCVGGNHPDFLISVNVAPHYACYHNIGNFTQTFWSGGVQSASVWAWGPPASG